MSLAVDLLTGCSVAAGALLCWLGYRGHSRYDEPGSTAFGAFAVAGG